MRFALVYEILLRIKSLGVFHFETTRKTEPPKIGVSFHLTFWVSTVSLAPIPENLRGFTWLTISELALVARVSEVALDYVLTPLSKNHKTLQMLRIEKAQERPIGKQTQSNFVHYYRPFTDMTVHARHFMGSKAGRAANEASISVELRSAISQQAPTPLQEAPQIPPPPRPTKPGRPADEDQWTRQDEGAKRLKRPPVDPFIAADRAQETAAAPKKSPKPPSFPEVVHKYVPFHEDDGSLACLSFVNGYTVVERSVVFAPPKPIYSGETLQEWEVDYEVSVRGAVVKRIFFILECLVVPRFCRYPLVVGLLLSTCVSKQK